MRTTTKNGFEIINGKCVIPEGVMEIPEDEFIDCNNLREIVIPSTITSIPPAAFFYCTSLERVQLPASLKEIGHQAFEGCSKLRSIDIPEGVTRLRHMFYRCSSLKSIMIHKSVSYVDVWAFGRCARLKTIEVDPDNPFYKSESNCCLTKDGETLVFGCKTSAIPSGVKNIEDFAFYGCKGLKSITIPDGVECIGENAFDDCTHITSINIPSSVKHVGHAAFGGAPLKDIYLSSKNPVECVDLRKGLAYNPPKDINLHVPEESVHLYKQHPYFKKFRMIMSWNG